MSLQCHFGNISRQLAIGPHLSRAVSKFFGCVWKKDQEISGNSFGHTWSEGRSNNYSCLVPVVNTEWQRCVINVSRVMWACDNDLLGRTRTMNWTLPWGQLTLIRGAVSLKLYSTFSIVLSLHVILNFSALFFQIWQRLLAQASRKVLLMSPCMLLRASKKSCIKMLIWHDLTMPRDELRRWSRFSHHTVMRRTLGVSLRWCSELVKAQMSWDLRSRSVEWSQRCNC